MCRVSSLTHYQQQPLDIMNNIIHETTPSYRWCEEMIAKALENGAEFSDIDEGVLGIGKKLVLHNPEATPSDRCFTYYEEYAVSPWVSDHKVYFYEGEGELPNDLKEFIDPAGNLINHWEL